MKKILLFSLLIISVLLFAQYAFGSDASATIKDGATNLFVNIKNTNCSDQYTRAQALYQKTPYCSIQPALNQLKGGDTLYIMAGNYNGDFILQNKNLNDSITIKAYPGHEVYLSDYDARFSKANSLWTKVSSGVWKTKITDSEFDWQLVYDGDGSRFFVFTDYAVSGGGNPLNQPPSSELFLTRPYEKSAYFNVATNELSIRFKNTSIDPNKRPIYVTIKLNVLTLSNLVLPKTKKITIEGLKFRFSREPLSLSKVTNVVVQNCSFYGAESAIRVRGGNNKDYAGTYIEIRNNYFNANYRHDWYHVDMKYQRAMEADSIFFTDYFGSARIHHNTLKNVAGAITLYTNEPKECDKSEVYNNLILDGEQSVLEIEDYCSNSKWHDNKIYTHYSGGLSWAPADASLSEKPCEFYNNEIIVLGQEENLATSAGKLVTYTGYAIKAQYRQNRGVYNWVVHHNTFVGKGRALNGILAGDGVEYGIWKNVNFTNNIFYAQEEYVLIRTGHSKDGVFYDYNLYYSPPGGYNPFTRWNNNANSTQYLSLAGALASPAWNGKWDIHSKEGNPNFASISNFSFKPSGIACTMSSTGSYVGAVPCK